MSNKAVCNLRKIIEDGLGFVEETLGSYYESKLELKPNLSVAVKFSSVLASFLA